MADSRSSRAFSRAWLTASGLAAIAGAWVLFTWPPATSRFYPRCMFHVLSGLDCPGCGITRALHELLHGRVEEAFRFNPMLFVLVFVALFAMPSLLRGETPKFVMTRWFGWSSLVVVSAFWIVRNTPMYPF